MPRPESPAAPVPPLAEHPGGRAPTADPPLVGVVMGSTSDWSVMRVAAETLAELGVAAEARVVSAHRTPDLLFEYAEQAEARGLRAIIAGAGGAAHLPGMLAAKTLVPVLGVPVPATLFNGVDSLLSIVQMPAGVPVGTLAVGKPGAVNAALLAAQMLATTDATLRARLAERRASRRDAVLGETLPPVATDAPVAPVGPIAGGGR